MLHEISQGSASLAPRIHRLLAAIYCSLSLEVSSRGERRENEALVALIETRPALFLCYTWACSCTLAYRSTAESSIYCLYDSLYSCEVLQSHSSEFKLASTVALLQGSVGLKLKQLLSYQTEDALDSINIAILWKVMLISCSKENCSTFSVIKSSSISEAADAVYDALFVYFFDFQAMLSDFVLVRRVQMMTRAVYSCLSPNVEYLMRWWHRASADMLKVSRLSDQKYQVLDLFTHGFYHDVISWRRFCSACFASISI